MASGTNRTSDLLALISTTPTFIITTAVIVPQDKISPNYERPEVFYTSTIALTTGVFFATAVYAAIVALCTVIALRAHMRQREERDKLGAILAMHAWPHEAQTDRAIRVIRSLGATEMFRGVTGYHVLAYKYRFDAAGANVNEFTNGATHMTRTRLTRYSSASTVDVFQTMRKIERLFDSLSLALPCVGKCPMHIRLENRIQSFCNISLWLCCDY